MNLVRGIGRLLLGGFFIVQGAKAVKDPDQFAPAAEPIADQFVPFARKTLPPEASAYVPEDPATLVRLNGALSVLGGLGMATGLGRRGGAYLAAASMVPHVLASNAKGGSLEEKHTARGLQLRNLALLGAALVVSQDTAGQPSMLWRANDSRKRLAHEAERTAEMVARRTGNTGKALAKDVRHFKRQTQLQSRLALKNLEAALP
ncbi:MAG: DoxX family membrane protein [Propionibacteriaceae bacterium]|nr:DoxX family membrane protein [Propionibacteriaceae bacterium]